MTRKRDRSPEEQARREKIRELLQLANVGSMDDIHELFKETIGEFIENGLEAELDEELGNSKYDYRNKTTDNSRNGHSSNERQQGGGEQDPVHVREGNDDRGHRNAHSGHLWPGSVGQHNQPCDGQDPAHREGL